MLNKTGSVSLLLLTISFSACTSATTVTPSSTALEIRPDSVKSLAEISDRLFFKFHSQGKIVATGNMGDLAIDGAGFFRLLDTAQNRYFYTRIGRFHVDDDGHIKSAEGYVLQPEMTLSKGKSFYILQNGSVISYDTNQKIWEKEVGRLTLSHFSYPELLKNEGKGYFSAIPEAGTFQYGQPGQNTFGYVIAGALEEPENKATFAQGLPPSPMDTPNETNQSAAGTLKTTGRSLDLAIEGKGYFSFLDPHSGMQCFSRRAKLFINGAGQVVSEHGLKLEPPIIVPLGYQAPEENIRFEASGKVYFKRSESDQVELGKISLYLHENTQGLQAYGYSRPNVLVRTQHSGKMTQAFPGEKEMGTIKSGMLFEPEQQDIVTLPESLLHSTIMG
ncbi:hypothetical protein COW36_10650 [bacterium (Candidatus Blackallbacteria) CG17_big_fil_post_rev_8_21_14_2_50_48_46]|uniref:Flagellar hook protein FlgE/F/G-like D1 domain-containing protein n=1 Tax=bacterium (Candidatus Blackallbacteria) CG17_big_fil_post_rev_8_21_14_2_50_48_46 TaxID=2014261 RepID=A0A2M7G4U1_9BACT|nr:MAG: hypothetical protein COW64_20670 [bacterium (Candidatus Blackallbacteria) CG18_big_fil_WC_8_21_14_2_50_49_26]PIW16927.1 MAG: hypothetical protein COW36_10650 [bacterium (Candidatus Blackallbacteria) CG17_big_fil_post_rev_8_21_14_2_50_48_46]PIW50205.1 MAG: hypothetical protein COW20_03160 [bacterium (Candidatus Blackallbacteria) CG13_big_fil_rev_8_21_14_2_50_49_14]